MLRFALSAIADSVAPCRPGGMPGRALTEPDPCARLPRPRRPHLTQKPPPSTPPAAAVDFEKALEELEATVEKLEHGDLSLEDALQQFERGVALARVCQTSLKQAEQKVEILLQRSADAVPAPFEPDDE